jgi:hypothetical protein
MPAISNNAAKRRLSQRSGRLEIYRGALLTQKDLADRWECSVRTVQRTREEFGLLPVDRIGNNPVFSIEHVEAVEELRRETYLIQCKARSKRARKQIGGILTLKQLKAKKARISKQHAKGLKP